MLVLTRRPSESIIIGHNIKITVVSVGPGRVKLGIEAPPEIRIDRKEIHDRIEQSADVLAALGDTNPDPQNTSVVHGPDTAFLVPAATPDAPSRSSAAQRPAPPIPHGSDTPATNSRLPRKPR
ncbi:MAG: carbon storage regulator [Gemmataceae bacterium]|nr:carbon storage regulator [Gemmata sp.]MDW8198998.1 carbon storage regulator [Gemmataceae bacterium]